MGHRVQTASRAYPAFSLVSKSKAVPVQTWTGPEVRRRLTGPEVPRRLTGPEVPRRLTGPEVPRRLTGPEVPRRLRLLDFKKIGT